MFVKSDARLFLHVRRKYKSRLENYFIEISLLQITHLDELSVIRFATPKPTGADARYAWLARALYTRLRTARTTTMGRAFDICMRAFSTVLGLIVILMGLVWIGQGLHIGPEAIMHGFMVSNRPWALYGAILAALGVGQVVWTNTRQRRR
jgi:hypothetical protein